MQHCSYPLELFNHMPQSCRLGCISAGVYTFSLNVVFKTLRLVNPGFFKPTAFKQWVVDETVLSHCSKQNSGKTGPSHSKHMDGKHGNST
jgi:hypothetical protein